MAMKVATGTHKHRDRKTDENPLCIMFFFFFSGSDGLQQEQLNCPEGPGGESWIMKGCLQYQTQTLKASLLTSRGWAAHYTVATCVVLSNPLLLYFPADNCYDYIFQDFHSHWHPDPRGEKSETSWEHSAARTYIGFIWRLKTQLSTWWFSHSISSNTKPLKTIVFSSPGKTEVCMRWGSTTLRHFLPVCITTL